MKKLLAIALALVMVLSLAACGGDKGDNTTAPADGKDNVSTLVPPVKAALSEYDSSSLETILASIKEEYNVTAEYLSAYTAYVEKKLSSKAAYEANPELLNDYYALFESEIEASTASIKAKYIDYCELVAATVDLTDYDALDAAFEPLTALAENEFETYQKVYADEFKACYNNIRSALVEDGYEDTFSILEEGDAAKTSIHEHFGPFFEFVLNVNDVQYEFADGNTDVEAILAAY